MERREFSLWSKVKFTSILLLIFLLIISIIGEVVVRHYFMPPSKEYSDKTFLDQEFGWLPKSDFQDAYTMKTHGDDPFDYDVNYTTDQNGFRVWGDVNSEKPIFFFVGDSYVQAVEVSTDKTFYSYIGDSLGVEVFAFGQAGYGSLQEKMILEKYIDVIQPDFIILQTCDNDFVDNYAPLEYHSKYRVGLRRPYYNLSGTIDYRRPMPRWKEYVDQSKFWGLIRRKIERTFFEKEENSSQDMMAKFGKEYAPYRISQEITYEVFKDIKKIADDIPIVAFSASPYEPQLTDMKEISIKAKIPFYESIGTKIQTSSWHKKVVYTYDGFHWTELGHKKVSDYLIAQWIKDGTLTDLKIEL